MNKNEIRINHESIEVDFIEHLRLQENNRILFTAPFGSGKSTFLQEVFSNNEKAFVTIKLFPVNYCVSANEDVFELIKFDLLIELLGNFKADIELKEEEFSALLLTQMFVLKELKLTPIIFAILKQCGKIGKSATDIIQEVKKQYKEFKTKTADNEGIEIATFLNLIQNQKGNKHEMDSVSLLIKNLINRLKEKRDAETVLIIDDLDRLDPEHTFRLINIFSAHFDKIDNSNKFGFDKVIFVCDFKNIKKIFSHRYGGDVDFSGYTDKFFALVPYKFDNRRYILEKVDDIIDSIKFGRYIDWLKNDQRFYVIVKAVINSLVVARQLNLRMLFQYPVFKLDEHFYGEGDFRQESIWDDRIIVMFYLVENFYGSFDVLREKLSYLKLYLTPHNFNSSAHLNRSDASSLTSVLMTLCLPLLLPKDVLNRHISSECDLIHVKYFDSYIHFRDSFNSRDLPKEFIKVTADGKLDSDEIKLNPYEVLLYVFDLCKKKGAFK